MAVLFLKKRSDRPALLILFISFAMFGSSFAQCLKKRIQKNRCKNIAKELSNGQNKATELKKCLVNECIKNYPSKSKYCSNPPHLMIPGLNASGIYKNLKVEDFFQEMSKRIAIHDIYNVELKRHFKSVSCNKKIYNIIRQIKRINVWTQSTKKDLGISSVTQSNKPPPLTETKKKLKSTTSWYDIQIQMLRNLTFDLKDMEQHFEPSNCIIPMC